jgi:hypothetical protein
LLVNPTPGLLDVALVERLAFLAGEPFHDLPGDRTPSVACARAAWTRRAWLLKSPISDHAFRTVQLIRPSSRHVSHLSRAITTLAAVL